MNKLKEALKRMQEKSKNKADERDQFIRERNQKLVMDANEGYTPDDADNWMEKNKAQPKDSKARDMLIKLLNKLK